MVLGKDGSLFLFFHRFFFHIYGINSIKLKEKWRKYHYLLHNKIAMKNHPSDEYLKLFQGAVTFRLFRILSNSLVVRKQYKRKVFSS